MAAVSKAGHRIIISVIVTCLLIGVLLMPAVTGESAAQQSQPETDNTVTRIDVYENGSARWTVRIRTQLSIDQRAREYAAFQDQFRNNTAQYLDPFRTRITGVVSNAENATGRQMRVTGFTASTSIQQVPRRWGVVTYEFTWVHFAAQQESRVIVGDVFQGGFFLTSNDTLQIVAPDGYKTSRVEPEPDSRDAGMLTWNGRTDFADTHPRVISSPATGQTRQNGSTASVDTDTQSDEDRTFRETITTPLVVGFILVVFVGSGLLIRYRQRIENGRDGGGATERNDEQPTGVSPTGQSTDVDDHATQQAVLTEEERVIELLDENGGRMRQAAIAEEFDWSASKTSRVIGQMAQENSIEKLRIGRENLVALPDDAQ
jgi:hypothetical protein